jgi:glycosyltransferase involved in cell wall biosynthesis
MKASVIIPAHDEEASLPGLLFDLGSRLSDGSLDVVVVCNGCSDRTAEVARATAPHARVLEIAEASKVASLQTGDDVSTVFPRFYVDADVRVSGDGLLALAGALKPPLAAVAPSVRYDTRHATRAVRRQVEVVRFLDPHHGGIHGTGVMGVTEAGRRRFDRWPDVIADDYFLDGLFAATEKHRVVDVTVDVAVAPTLRDLARRKVRVVRANAEARPMRPAGHERQHFVRFARQHPRCIPDLLVYMAMSIWCHGEAWVGRRRGGELLFVRDRSRESRR